MSYRCHLWQPILGGTMQIYYADFVHLQLSHIGRLTESKSTSGTTTVKAAVLDN